MCSLDRNKNPLTHSQDLRDPLNYGLYLLPSNGRAGKFLEEERLLSEYPIQGPIGFLEVSYLNFPWCFTPWWFLYVTQFNLLNNSMHQFQQKVSFTVVEKKDNSSLVPQEKKSEWLL